jgi:hypothetical protein
MEIIFTNVTAFELESPQPASKLIPTWYKDTVSYVGGVKKPTGDGKTDPTIKRCMPVFDALTAGYIISSPADVYVSIKDGQQYFEWAALHLINFHPIEQAPNHPLKNGYYYPKWNNPWSIKTPKGYSVLVVQPMHRGSVFTILPGIVDTDSYTPPISFPMVINDPLFEGLIPKGTPIAQIIPFKRDKWKMKLGYKKELDDQKKKVEKSTTKFFDKYKEMFWTRKEYT